MRPASRINRGHLTCDSATVQIGRCQSAPVRREAPQYFGGDPRRKRVLGCAAIPPGTLLDTFVQSPSESARGLLCSAERGFYPEEGDPGPWWMKEKRQRG
jgi:hypothetical protein